MLFSHDTLENYYKTNFSLMQHHKYSLSELDDLMPWERGVYLDMLKAWIEAENKRIKDEQAVINAKRRSGR